MIPNLTLEAIAIFAAGAATGALATLLLRRKKPRVSRGAVVIDASKVAGRGAFAQKAIKEGDIVERCPALEVTDKDIGGELLNYVFYGSAENKRLVAMGYGMLFNHSPSPPLSASVSCR